MKLLKLLLNFQLQLQNGGKLQIQKLMGWATSISESWAAAKEWAMSSHLKTILKLMLKITILKKLILKFHLALMSCTY